MKHIPILLVAAVTLSGCATARDFTVCTLMAGVANQRGASFNGRIDGQPYKTSATWTADQHDPNFLDPIACTQMLSKAREMNERQAAASSPSSSETQANDVPLARSVR